MFPIVGISSHALSFAARIAEESFLGTAKFRPGILLLLKLMNFSLCPMNDFSPLTPQVKKWRE
jgi:hypothetical protein